MIRKTERAVDVQADGVRSPVAVARLADLSRNVLRALRIPRAMISITLVSSRAIARLNKEHLGHRGPTDVITFSLTGTPEQGVLADIYICPDVARAHAIRHRIGIREEIARLVVHGTMHACGWDHPDDDRRTTSPMWRRQERFVQRFWTSPTHGA